MGRAPKHCGETGCGTLTIERYCPPHKALRQARASSTARGYGTEHQRRRAALLPTAYGQACPLCGDPMLQGQPLDLDHSTPLVRDRSSKGDRMAHARCNRSAGSGQKRTTPPSTP